MLTATVTLFAHLLHAPATTGAVAPSSPFLARAMADDADGAGHILELGAGTGSLTQALAKRFPSLGLTLVEVQPVLAAKLARRFPQARLHVRPAAEVLDGLECPDGPVVVVSSLPFRSLPERVRAQTRASILSFLARHPGSWLVQYTYHPRAPFDPGPDFTWQRRATVFANLPPAGVWTLRPKPSRD